MKQQAAGPLLPFLPRQSFARRRFFISPPPRRPPLWFMKDEPIPTETTVVQLMGVHQDAKARIWKEVHLFKERRMVHVYDIRWEVAEGDRSLETNERDAKLL